MLKKITSSMIHSIISNVNNELEDNKAEHFVKGSLNKKINNQLVPYRRLIYHICRKTCPDIFLELGSYRGDTSNIVLIASPTTKVIGVDDESAGEITTKYIKDNRFVYINKKTTDPETVKIVKEESKGSVDILFVDACHKADYVRKELAAFLTMMGTGGIILFDDYNICMAEKVCKAYSWSYRQVIKNLGGPLEADRDFGIVII